MKKIFAVILLLFAIFCAPQPARSGFWDGTMLGRGLSAVGGFVSDAVEGVVDLSISAVNAVASAVGSAFDMNEVCGFEKRLASYVTDSCWFCGVLGDAFDIMNDIVSETCSTLQPVFLTLLGLGLLFWLLFNVGKKMLDFSGESPVIADVFKQVMRVMVATLLIIFYLDVFDYGISPLLRFGIGLGNRITGQELTGYTLKASRANPSSATSMAEQGLCPELQVAMAKEAASPRSRGRGTGTERVFNDVVKESFLCYVRVGSAAMMTGMAIGSTAIHAWGDMGLLDKLRHMQLPMIGLIIFLSFFCLFLAFPLKLFDPLTNLTFVTAMFPLWVVMWAFPGFGKSYFQKAVDMFASVIVNLIVISIMSVICINIMNSALGGKADRMAMFQALKECKRAATIFEGVGDTGLSAGLGGFGLVGKATLMTLALGYFSFQLFKKTTDIAKNFKGGIQFGMNEAAGAAFGGAETSLIRSGANATSAGWHSVAPTEGVMNESRQNSLRGAAIRTGMMLSGNPIAMAAGIRRFNKTPAPVGHTGTGTIGDSLRTSRLGNMWNRLRGRDATWSKTKDKATKATYRLDRKTGIATRTDRNGTITRYDRNNGSFTEVSKTGGTSTYNMNTGKMTFGDKAYMYDAKTGNMMDMEGKAVIDPDLKAKAAALQMNAESNRADFDERFRNNGWDA